MSRRTLHRAVLTFLLILCAAVGAYGQAAGSYTPYSIYGVGDLSHPGTAWNKTMGGVGIATRNNNYINITNPASVTARDSLSFMTDFSLFSDNKIFNQGGIVSASNTFNINDIAVSFPIFSNHLAMMGGIQPFSDTGFGYSFNYTDPELIGRTGNITYSATGNGSIYKLFAAVGVRIGRNLSLGAQWNFYFGNISKYYYTTFNDASYNSIHNSTEGSLSGHGFKVGLQYEQPINAKLTIGVGVTYASAASLGGSVELGRYSSGSAAADTLYHRVDKLGVDSKVAIPSEIGVGVVFKNPGKWSLEVDYTRADWSASGIDNARGFTASNAFKASVAEAWRVGFEIVPNRNDIRNYFNHVAYRAGAYYKNDYFLLDGQKVSSMGVTLGLTFPIVNLISGLTVGVDLGQRGSLAGNQIRERYINFSIGFNLYDLWFRKYQYQ